MPVACDTARKTAAATGAVGPNVIVYARRNLSRPIATTLGLAQQRAKGAC